MCRLFLFQLLLLPRVLQPVSLQENPALTKSLLNTEDEYFKVEITEFWKFYKLCELLE